MKRAQQIRVKVTNARGKVRTEEKKPEAWFANIYLNHFKSIKHHSNPYTSQIYFAAIIIKSFQKHKNYFGSQDLSIHLHAQITQYRCFHFNLSILIHYSQFIYLCIKEEIVFWIGAYLVSILSIVAVCIWSLRPQKVWWELD